MCEGPKDVHFYDYPCIEHIPILHLGDLSICHTFIFLEMVGEFMVPLIV